MITKLSQTIMENRKELELNQMEEDDSVRKYSEREM